MDKVFIALGIEYDAEKFKMAKNRRIYADTNFPPTKPIEGGFWGSIYYENMKYKSEWERYVNEVLDPKLFSDKLNGKSTLFKIKENAKVLELKSFNDVWIDFRTNESNLALRQIKVAGAVPKQYEYHFFLDFERFSECYDAIYVSQNFVKRVDWVLKEYERRILFREKEYDENLTDGDLYISELFEDWNVDSILVLNKSSVEIKKII